MQLFVVGTFVIDWDFGKLLQGYTTEAFRDSYFLLNWTVSITPYCFVVPTKNNTQSLLKMILAQIMTSGLTVLFIALHCIAFPFPKQTTMLYFLVDLVWVSLVPISVKSPDVIVKVCALEL